MKPTLVHCLSLLAKKNITTEAELANALSISQQTVSRWVSLLRNENLIHKKGGKYVITEAGCALLASLVETRFRFRGRVFTGLGEGKYYLNKKGFTKQFNKLGFTPFPGTLNLRIPEEQGSSSIMLRRTSNGITLDGFKEKDREYGSALCVPALARGIKAMIIVPERTHYNDVLELISPFNLRKKLSLKDGEVMDVEVLSE